MQLLTCLGVPYAHCAITAARQHLAAITAVQNILQPNSSRKQRAPEKVSGPSSELCKTDLRLRPVPVKRALISCLHVTYDAGCKSYYHRDYVAAAGCMHVSVYWAYLHIAGVSPELLEHLATLQSMDTDGAVI